MHWEKNKRFWPSLPTELKNLYHLWVFPISSLYDQNGKPGMWNPLILQHHREKHHIATLLALQAYPWVAGNPLQNICNVLWGLSPYSYGPESDTTPLHSLKCKEHVCGVMQHWDPNTIHLFFLWYLVSGSDLECPGSTMFCRQGFPEVQWGQEGMPIRRPGKRREIFVWQSIESWTVE